MGLNTLPIELHWNIAKYLDSNKDLAHYGLICHDTHNALTEPSKNFWRVIFNRTFDKVDDPLTAAQLEQVYKERGALMRLLPYYRDGKGKAEIYCLRVLRDLLLEAKFVVEGDDSARSTATSKNHEHIKTILKTTNLLKVIGTNVERDYYHSWLMQAIQITLAPYFLRPDGNMDHVGFLNSQWMVYASARLAPIFQGPFNLKVNIPWVLNVLNFFKKHLLHDKEQNDLAKYYIESLGEFERPSVCKQPFQLGSYKLGKHWKGTYSYIERYESLEIRSSFLNEHSEPYVDKNIDYGKNALQDLDIEFPAANEFDQAWPAIFETHLRSMRLPLPQTSRRFTRAQYRNGLFDAESMIAATAPYPSLRFKGEGYDEEDFLSQGWLNPLPPQQGIPGWQRLTMMKYFADEHGNIDLDALWAYEGVVLPGGQIIIGRWWSPDDNVEEGQHYSGPFILWNVDASVPSCEKQ